MRAGISGRSPVHLLVVDDNPVFTETLVQRLCREPSVGVVEAVTSAGAARECLRTTRPDVVLLDYNLDGPSVPLIRNILAGPDAPVVLIMSGSEEVPDIVLALEAGAAGWLTKSTPVPDLLSGIDRALDGDVVLPAHTVGSVIRHLLGELRRTPRS